MHYYSLNAAKEHLVSRQADQALQREVMKVIGKPPLETFGEKQFVAISQHVATAKWQDVRFTEAALEAGLVPIWMEYTHDSFCSANGDKNALWSLFVYSGNGKRGGPKLQKYKVIEDPVPCEKKRICDITTISGESLVELHHRIRKAVFTPEIAQSVVDMSNWLTIHGGRAELYYKAYLSLFVLNGVLCEDFDEFPGQRDSYVQFRERVFLPSWEWVLRTFGYTPLITRLPWEEYMGWYHPEAKLVLANNGSP